MARAAALGVFPLGQKTGGRKMPADEPYRNVLSTLDRWEEAGGELDEVRRRLVPEVRGRIRRLGSDYSELMAINAAVAAERTMRSEYDPAAGTLNLEFMGRTFKIPARPTDPNTKPEVRYLGWVESFAPGDELPITPETAGLVAKIPSLLEGYYSNAHTLLTRVQILVGRRNIDCPPIKIVRNKLIHHADAGDIFSYGCGSAGPLIRPARPVGSKWRDDGLVPNTRALAACLVDALALPPVDQ